MFYIYCYTNKISKRKYVGQTNNLKRRKNEHRSNSFNPNSSEYNLLFHKKLREYGEDNFIFSVLEEIDTDDLSIVNEREKFWIQEMQSYVEQHGYNLTYGGENQEHSRIYSPEVIQEIKNLIKQKVSYDDISKIYNISSAYLSELNHGNLYFDEKETYPLCKYYSSKDEIQILIDLLKNTDIPMTEIAKQINKSYSYVKKVNAGTLCFNKDLIYPIRKVNAGETKALEIQKLLQLGKSDEEIMQQIEVSKSTIKRINLGQTHYNSSLTYPLRKPVSTI